MLAVIAVAYAALFYRIAHMRGALSVGAGGRSMFGPVISKMGEARDGITESKPRRLEENPSARQEWLIPPSLHWAFPPIDLFPSAPGWTATATEFTPVTEAGPDPPEAPLPRDSAAAQSPPRGANLRMVRWFRPAYDAGECPSLQVDTPLVLDLRIDADGRPADITIERSTESRRLDEIALRAASVWRFAPPLWKSRPVEVRARVTLRFSC